MVMPSLFAQIDGGQFNDLVQSVIGKPDSDGKYYLTNCVVSCPYPPFMLIRLTDHKMLLKNAREQSLCKIYRMNFSGYLCTLHILK